MKSFKNISEFVAFMETRADLVLEAGTVGLDNAARIVVKEAKREIGTYQDEAGPFPDWPELSPSTKRDRLKKGFSEDEPGLRTGEMRDSISHVTHGREAVIGSDSDKLLWFELGTVGPGNHSQPPRSVLGLAVVHKEEQIVDAIAKPIVRLLSGNSFRARIDE